MGIVTTYTCDKCRETCDKEILYKVEVVLKRHMSGMIQHNNTYPWQYWCLTCLRRTGMVPTTTSTPQTEQPPSLEDIIRDIVVDALENQ